MAPESILALLGGRRDDPQSQRLGQDQDVAGPGARVGDDRPGIHSPHHGQAEDRLLGLDRMPADDGDARLVRLVDRASEDLGEDLGRQGPAREADQAERRQGNSGHGVDVAQGVGRRDGAEVVRPVDDRREEIGRQDQRQVVADPVNRRVVGRRMADDHVGVDDRRQPGQEREQVVRRLLGRAAGSLGELSEADRVEIETWSLPA